MRIILASASPRRKELLEQVGITFEVIPSTVEEKMQGTTPGELVESLALQKAEDVFNSLLENANEDLVVLGSDTIVVCDGKRLGKPLDEPDAFRMLKMLSDREHEVYTGVCVMSFTNGQKQVYTFCECTKVRMFPITDEQARWYISTNEPMDKAGSYGIQGMGAVFIKGITGDYNSVVGLPVAKVWQYFTQNGIVPINVK